MFDGQLKAVLVLPPTASQSYKQDPHRRESWMRPMSLLYEHHDEQVMTPLPLVDSDALAEMNVIIYDSV